MNSNAPEELFDYNILDNNVLDGASYRVERPKSGLCDPDFTYEGRIG